MSFGQNVQFLRKMHIGMTQEELAEKLGVSRQTVSKWESDSSFPEMEKALALCELFSCSLDELLRGDMVSGSEDFLDIRLEKRPPFQYVRYAVISPDPEGDATRHLHDWAIACGIGQPEIVGWDFPFLSQEQINVYHMHGYTAACILPEGAQPPWPEILTQPAYQYAVITIKEPFSAPFMLIPNAYKTLVRYMEVNGLKRRQPCSEHIYEYEKVYEIDGTTYMDIYLTAE